MSTPLSETLRQHLAAGEPVIAVTIAQARGSTPREAGTTMLVTRRASTGTIGGGQLEFHAIDLGRAMIAAGEAARDLDMPLGPVLGQCCGGHVTLSLRAVGPAEIAHLAALEIREAVSSPAILVFGFGHTGLALARALAPLPYRTSIVDDRPGLAAPPKGVRLRHVADPVQAVAEASANTAFVILTHSHALDYRLAQAALNRRDAAYVGMIGSATKRARFHRFFAQAGGSDVDLARLVCPIAGSPVPDKRPAVIAALTAAELIRALALSSHAQMSDRYPALLSA